MLITFVYHSGLMLVNDPVLDSRFTSSLFDMKELEASHADNHAVFEPPISNLHPSILPLSPHSRFLHVCTFFVFYTFFPHFACSTEYGYELDSD